MKKNGFTLTELLAVIAIIGILSTIATFAVAPHLIKSKESALETTLTNLEDSAITYALENLFIPNNCAITYYMSESHATFDKPSGCTIDTDKLKVQVRTLISEGYFKDDAKIVDRSGYVYIYKYKEKKSKSFLECYNGNNFIEKDECYNYDTKAFANKSLVTN